MGELSAQAGDGEFHLILLDGKARNIYAIKS
jgi:hypothetical protein